MYIWAYILLAYTSTYQDDSPEEITSRFGASNYNFTAELYKRYALNTESTVDFVLSPFSVQLALAIIHSAANGSTAEEIARTLGLPNDKEKIKRGFDEIFSNFKKTQNYTLDTANKLYVNDGYKIDGNFKKVTGFFKGEVEAVDFKYPAETAKIINNWLMNKTEGIITDAIEYKRLNENIESLMISSLYFKGRWALRFDRRQTAHQTFIDSLYQEKSKNMMTTSGWFKYSNNRKLKAIFLELDYEDNNTTMTIVVPCRLNGLSDLQIQIEQVLARQKYLKKRMRLTIPKFMMETTTGMGRVLMELGIRKIFTPDAELCIAKEPLAIDAVLQKNVFQVSEEGTLVPPAQDAFESESREYKLPRLVVNHPFLFFIKVSDVIVFIGQYTG